MSKEKKVYTVADAHLDTSWVWTFETTVGEYIPRTFNDNFSLFEKYPEYKFNFEGSYRYELMKEYYPAAFERVKRYVKEGRWWPCGSCYENGDVNIPSPEALIRNVIYGNGFFRDNFGTWSNDIFLPDCFGFGKALPSVAAHCGLTGFSTQKLTWGCAVPIPFDVGRWNGLDGNGLWCAIKTGNYTSNLKTARNKKSVLDKLSENEEKYDFSATMEYHGVGDRGGAPKEPSVQTVCRELRENDSHDIKVLSATTGEFFDDIEALPEEAKKKLPVFDGEFLMTEHGAGSYTSRAISKRWNRRSELLADAAERTAVSAYILGLADYPSNVLDTAWKRTIAHQFHDDITGTSWMVDYKRNWNDYVQAMNSFSTEYTAAVKAMTGAMDTSFAKGVAVAVSSPVQCTGNAVQAVSANVPVSSFPASARVFDSDGNEVPSQICPAEARGFKKVTFMASVPANGIRIYDVRPSAESFSGDTGLLLKGNRLENNRYRVIIDVNGDISAVYDKKLNKELFSAPIRLELLNDPTLYDYSAWEVKYKSIMSKPYAYACKPVLTVLENGPVYCALEIKRTLGDSSVTQVISLDAGSDFVRVYNEVDWRSESSNLKVSFPTSCNSENAYYDIGIGRYPRPTNTEKQFEVPAQRWADMTEPGGSYGVSILSDSRTGWDKPNENTIRLTAVHTATNCHSYLSAQNLCDFGLNRFSFGIAGHAGKPDFSSCPADRFCQPMHTFVCDSHKGKLSPVFSLCSVSSDSVRIMGLKKAQDTDEIVIRLCEYTGKAQDKVKVQFALPVKSAKEIRGDEVALGDISVKKGVLELDFAAHQIRSIAVTLKDKAEYSSKCKTVKLPYNLKASTFNRDDEKVTLANGFSVPAELLPETLLAGGISYAFTTKGDNAVSCAGQEIKLPAGAKKVHFILTSIAGDRKAVFTVGGKKVTVPVQDCFEAVGAWDLIGLGETGYIKTKPQIFTFTHTHGPAGDEIAKQFYLFHAEIDCVGESTITLPDDANIIIFAASTSGDKNSAVPSDKHFDTLERRKFDYELSGFAKKLMQESSFKKHMNELMKKLDETPSNAILTRGRKYTLNNVLHAVKDKAPYTSMRIRSKGLEVKRKLDK